MSEQCPICNGPLSTDVSICPTCGFKLLGSTQSFKPFAFNGQTVVEKVQKTPTEASLRIVRGPQIETVFNLRDGTASIGRSPRCDIFLNDMTVSREHAFIERSGNGYRITDANSYNGVWIDNSSIESTDLHNGNIIQIGAFCLLYQESPSSY